MGPRDASKRGVEWSPQRLIRTIDDLPSALGVQSLSEVGDYIEARLPDVGDLWFDWENASIDSVPLGNDLVDMFIHDFELPRTLRGLRRNLDHLAERVSRRLAAFELGTEDDGKALTVKLAHFFGVPFQEFLASVGGGWHPVDGTFLTGDSVNPISWLGAGEPLQLLLGVGEDEATVARPIVQRPGLLGPGGLYCDNMLDFDLYTAASYEALVDGVSSILKKSRRGWKFCDGCRRYLPVGKITPSRAQLCDRCLYEYGGVILD